MAVKTRKIYRSIIIVLCVAGLITLLLIGFFYTSARSQFPSDSIQSLWVMSKWMPVFEDQFNGQVLDASKWVTCYWWDASGCTNRSNHELEWYQPANDIVKDGYLLLTAKQETVSDPNGQPYAYTSGMVTTGSDSAGTKNTPRFAFTYGFLQVRAWTPGGKGLWPAIWLLPANQNSKPEIDVMELRGSQPDVIYMNFHYLNSDGTEGLNEGQWTSDTDLSAGFHTYAVDWEPNAITWYVDGIERRRFSDPTKIPSTPMYLLINLAVGGDWPGSPDQQTILPNMLIVDYVQIWQPKDRINVMH